MQQAGQTLFIVWRESVEALLVIGILYGWLQTLPENRRAAKYLWGGVATGLAVAVATAAVLLAAGIFLSSELEEYVQIAMLAAATALIVWTVLWIRRGGRTMKSRMVQDLSENLRSGGYWSIFSIAMLAVAREGSETAVFIYGVGIGRSGASLAWFIAGAGLGLALAAMCAYLLQLGGRLLPRRVFFGIAEIILLFLGAAMWVGCGDRLISMGILPVLHDQIWDFSPILADDALGGLLSAFTGYRARPSLVSVLLYMLYWGSVLWLIHRPRPQCI